MVVFDSLCGISSDQTPFDQFRGDNDSIPWPDIKILLIVLPKLFQDGGVAIEARKGNELAFLNVLDWDIFLDDLSPLSWFISVDRHVGKSEGGMASQGDKH